MVMKPSEFRASWALRHAENYAAAPAADLGRATGHILGLAPAAQQLALQKHRTEYPHFCFWVERQGWETVEHPLEFWQRASKEALPDYRIHVIWYDTPTQYVYICAYVKT